MRLLEDPISGFRSTRNRRYSISNIRISDWLGRARDAKAMTITIPINIKERTTKALTTTACQPPQTIEKTIVINSIINTDAIFIGLRKAVCRMKPDLKCFP
jgi:hypothetical protein